MTVVWCLYAAGTVMSTDSILLKETTLNVLPIGTFLPSK